MHALTLFLASLPIVALGRANNHFNRMPASRHVRKDNSGYTLRVKHQGSTFFDGWNFFTGNDPTGGNVEFLDRKAAAAAGLAYVQGDGTTVLAVDNKSKVPPGGKRKSVRISSKATYNDGLFIADIFKVPHGNTTWPAYWSSGPNWPNGGEIDIIEYVNEATTNQYTIHTSADSGCTLDRNAKGLYKNATNQVQAFLGNVMGTECSSWNGHNSGCAFADSGKASAGTAFNMMSGGIIAHLWDKNQISIWRFPRSEIPQDIIDGKPDPTGWGTPMAFWSSDTCDLSRHFYSHSLIFDITICGDWAGSVYNNAGHPTTCSEAVAQSSNYDWAMWKINYVAVYGASS